MPTQATIQRIAKLLARATSPEAGEAQAALEGAFKRMKRDGVSFDDLLALPQDDLYQDILVKLIDLMLADQPNLSHASRREAYKQYMLLIVAKFSGGWDGQRAGEGSRGNNQDDDRETAAVNMNADAKRKKQPGSETVEMIKTPASRAKPDKIKNLRVQTLKRQNRKTPIRGHGKAKPFPFHQQFSWAPCKACGAGGRFFGTPCTIQPGVSACLPPACYGAWVSPSP